MSTLRALPEVSSGAALEQHGNADRHTRRHAGSLRAGQALVAECFRSRVVAAPPRAPAVERGACAPRSRARGTPGLVAPYWLTALVALGLASACASAPRRSPSPSRRPPAVRPAVGTVALGLASWYGPGYDGKPTSSGERFDQDALTAAHYDWAFGTRVRVTLASTGKSIVVRINDRFPNHKGRILDVSRAAARAIGLIGPGTGRVRLEVVE